MAQVAGADPLGISFIACTISRASWQHGQRPRAQKRAAAQFLSLWKLEYEELYVCDGLYY